MEPVIVFEDELIAMRSLNVPDVGQRIRAIREQRGLSLRALAERCHLSINAISKIERGENSPTVASLHMLASALGVPITEFFDAAPVQNAIHTKNAERPVMKREGMNISSLGGGLPNQKIEPFLITLEAGAGTMCEPITHAGHEFIYCLQGQVEYHVSDVVYTLETGDSLLFEARLPHCFVNRSEQFAMLLVIFQVTRHQDHLITSEMCIG